MNEKFIIEVFDDGGYIKTSLIQMKNKIIHYVFDDPSDKGFYILCSKEYDEKIELEHSHRDELFIDFERQIEPGIIKILDLNIQQEAVKDKENSKKITMSFVGLRDDEYTFDRCTYFEDTLKN